MYFVPPMLGGLQMNVQLATSKHWLGMTIIGICELGGEGTRGGSCDSGVAISGTSSRQHYLYLSSSH